MTAYFDINRRAKEAIDRGEPLPFKKDNGRPLDIMKNPLDYVYADFPEYFVYQKTKKRWKVRKKGALGRIVFISPK